jgi:hypothetical protein
VSARRSYRMRNQHVAYLDVRARGLLALNCWDRFYERALGLPIVLSQQAFGGILPHCVRLTPGVNLTPATLGGIVTWSRHVLPLTTFFFLYLLKANCVAHTQGEHDEEPI